MRFLTTLLLAALGFTAAARAQEDEIVANLAGGRVLIHITRDAIVFGASEWQVPAQPRPIRLDREVGDLRSVNSQTYQPPGSGDPDLELIGVGFLEKLRPLVSQLHHKFDLKPDEPIFEIVLIGYAPKMYGPEVWLIDYGAEQESVGSRAEYWQTHVLRPRFTQLYPPEKHQAKTLIEVRFPPDLQATPLMGLIQQNDPRLAQVRSSDPRFAKLTEELEHGQANKAATQDSVDFLRAALPLLAGGATFSEGKMEEAGGFEWIVPPEEPVERQRAQDQKAQDKDRPADAPSLVRKPKPQP